MAVPESPVSGRLGEHSGKDPHTHAAPAQDVQLLGEGSPGVHRIEIINSHFRLFDRICLFASVFLIAYVYGLDGTVRYTYQVSFPEGYKMGDRNTNQSS